MFTRAIVKTPCQAMINGLTEADLGTPNYAKALIQHQDYINALQECGLSVTVLDADEAFADSTFVEDVALLTPHCAIITNPGAPTRNQETQAMRPVINDFFDVVESISSPGTIEGGDIMMVGNHYYIGLSKRTNQQGADQLIKILQKYGMTGSTIPLTEVLHLKTGISYLENNHLLVSGEFKTKPEFQTFSRIAVDDNEAYAACSLWINDTVITPTGFPKTKALIEAKGFKTREIDLSEFQKIDGGLSCLSLRF